MSKPDFGVLQPILIQTGSSATETRLWQLQDLAVIYFIYYLGMYAAYTRAD